MGTRRPVVFLCDVDNALLDNDRIAADLKRHLEREIGHDRQERSWAIFEELREERGYGSSMVGDVIDRVAQLGSTMAYTKRTIRDKLIEHREYIRKHGDDMPDVRDWKWTDA